MLVSLAKRDCIYNRISGGVHKTYNLKAAACLSPVSNDQLQCFNVDQ